MYYCGWDGGGTKTEVCIANAAGAQTAGAAFGPLNPNGAAADVVRATVRDALGFMAAQEGGLDGCAALVIGIAGVSNAVAARQVEEAVRAGGYAGPLRLLGDEEIALAGAIHGHGAVLVAGTGSVCFGRDARGRTLRVGGWGHLIDDGGSGYALGRDILSAVVRAADGRLPATALTEAVHRRLDLGGIGELITWLYAPGTGKREVAALAPLLFEALAQGDTVAADIADRAAGELAKLAITAWQVSGMTGGELALTGSLLTRQPTMRRQVAARVAAALPDVRIVSPWGTAAQGAAALALEG